jgi:hypothetical protein
MSSTTEGRKPAKWYAMERALAPHVDKKWAKSFILELRMLDVEGARIGAALSEVESHCSDSGQSAQQALGTQSSMRAVCSCRRLARNPRGPCCVRRHRSWCRS